MLINGTHILPDPSGAIFIPKTRSLVLSDPFSAKGPSKSPPAREIQTQIESLFSRRRPAQIIWIGDGLATHFADFSAKDQKLWADLGKDWVFVGTKPNPLGEVKPEYKSGALWFRNNAQGAGLGEILAQPNPVAVLGEQIFSAYVFDGRRLILPQFGPTNRGENLLSASFSRLFRRPAQVLMIANGNFVTRPRAAFEALGPMVQNDPKAALSNQSPQSGARMQLFQKFED